MKLNFFFAGLFLFFIFVGFLIYNNNFLYKEISKPTILEPIYQGAVPEGYDLTYFRKTGITIPLNKTLN